MFYRLSEAKYQCQRFFWQREAFFCSPRYLSLQTLNNHSPGLVFSLLPLFSSAANRAFDTPGRGELLAAAWVGGWILNGA